MQLSLSRLALGALGAISVLGPASAQTASQFHGHTSLPQTTAHPVHVSTMQPHTVGARVDVQLDRTSVVRLPASASAVVVGNPAIADIAVHSTDTLLVLGRSYGSTNILAMDAVGRIISDTTVHVGASRGQNSLRVYEGGDSRRTYACEPDCLPAPQLGDDADYIGAYRPAAPQINDQFVSQGSLGAPVPGSQPAPNYTPPPQRFTPQPSSFSQPVPSFVPSVPVSPSETRSMPAEVPRGSGGLPAGMTFGDG